MISQTLQRTQSYLRPLMFLAVAAYGALLVLLELLTLQGTSDILDRDKLSARIFGKVWLRMNATIKKDEEATTLPSLIAQAHGTVLELGPGSGSQLSRYSKSKGAITHIYGVEPNVALHPQLRETVDKEGWGGRYTILPCGIEDLLLGGKDGFGVGEGEVDTVVSVQVLCSVPELERVVRALYRLLKPGGVMVVYEHVRSGDWLSRVVQDIYGIIWPFAMGNCHLDRPTGKYLMEAGKWAEMDVQWPKPEDAHLVLPRVYGTFKKA